MEIILEEPVTSLAEKVFILSEAGQQELSKEDWQGIAPKDRLRAMDIFNALRENKGIIDLTEKKAAKKKAADKTISLEDLTANIDKLSREERDSVLEKMDNLREENLKASKEEGFSNLPEDIQASLGVSPDNLKKLTKDQRTTLLKKFDDILQVEKEKKKQGIIQEAIK